LRTVYKTLETANLVMDEFVRFSTEGDESFREELIHRVYDSTVHGNPMRKYVRDVGVYETTSEAYMQVHTNSGHAEYTRDVMVEFLRVKNYNAHDTVDRVYRRSASHGIAVDKCHYHQHSETHPRCVLEPGGEGEQPTE
jgi:hypothetical protein